MTFPVDSFPSVPFARSRTLFFGRFAEPIDAQLERPFATMLPAFDEGDRHAAAAAVLALVQRGCVELCCVGPQAELLHGAIDSIIEDAGAFEVVTTADEDLVDGCEYFLFAAAGAPPFLLALVADHPELVDGLVEVLDNSYTPESGDHHLFAQELRARGLALDEITLMMTPVFGDLLWDVATTAEVMQLPPALILDPNKNERRLVLQTIKDEIRYCLYTHRDPHTPHEVELELGVLATADDMFELVTEFLLDEVPPALLRTPRFSNGKQVGKQST